MSTMTPATSTPTDSTGAATLLPRTMARLARGDIAYVDRGDPAAPAAVFVHGVLVNADLWRNVIDEVSDLRRCVALDLPAHGASPAPSGEGPSDALSLEGLASALEELCARLGLDRVDVVANDTGGAVAQVFAARHPGRMRTLTLTNCDVHDNFPPEPFKPFVALAESGELGPIVAGMAGDLALARSEAGYAQGYAHPDRLGDALLRSYLRPFAADNGRGLERFLISSSADELMAIEPLLAQVRAPTQVAWGTADVFFEPAWADRLAAMIPGTARVTLVPDAMLFWPDERAGDLVALLRDFWEAHA